MADTKIPDDAATERGIQETYATLERAGEVLVKGLGHGSVFAIFAWDAQTQVSHLWVPNESDPEQVKSMLAEALYCINEPERLIGGN